MAYQIGFFAYLRLKLFVALLRGFMALHGFLPTPAKSPSSSPTPAPILVNWHGSCWVFSLHGTDELYCRRIAAEASMYVLDADYRKGPETPYPGPLHDVEDALRWVASWSPTSPSRPSIPDVNIDTTRVALSGFSAGGQLALVASSACRKKTTLANLGLGIAAVVAVYPETDLSLAPEVKTARTARPIRPHPAWFLDLFHDSFVPDGALRETALVSPSKADVGDFPRVVAMMTAEGDIYSPEALELAGRLEDEDGEGKRKVVVVNSEGVYHGFDKGPEEGSKEWERREECYGAVVECLREALGTV
ncbi:Alpha/Beta hydrolase protein [Bombardia bombarda]|uniref:Alpha/Beta hydrolase protein n=1 Tax=Bombardia bombarda TaxID=252184 RepID=A0AA39XNG8_9PEZI|nr:Alpha/Beta hydrolase protein [Bombardia bombarda]